VNHLQVDRKSEGKQYKTSTPLSPITKYQNRRGYRTQVCSLKLKSHVSGGWGSGELSLQTHTGDDVDDLAVNNDA
jgi:hypothetical protein